MATLLRSLRNLLPTSAAADRHFLKHQLPRAALYHSHHHAPPPPPFSAAASAILSSSLTHVPEHGFTDMALTLGARGAGYLDITTNLFPRGPFEIVYYHLVMSRLNLHQRVQFPSAEELGVGQKLRMLVVERLRANEKVLGRWQEALGLMSLAGNIPTSISELAKLSDEILYLAGDTSVDTTWYTKRASLSAIYASTELFMTQDTSPDFICTWKFLDRRLEDIQALGKATSEVGDYFGFTANAVMNILRSKSVIR
ncbi:COQ9-domain-containing protein [Terfezia claveryi]|nr:COQ9-domain-containing protein [Terfezia claveryi]